VDTVRVSTGDTPAAALPIGPGGAATQAGAGSAVLGAAGVDPPLALGVLAGGAVVRFAAVWGRAPFVRGATARVAGRSGMGGKAA
jgi:hypothetical protein